MFDVLPFAHLTDKAKYELEIEPVIFERTGKESGKWVITKNAASMAALKRRQYYDN